MGVVPRQHSSGGKPHLRGIQSNHPAPVASTLLAHDRRYKFTYSAAQAACSDESEISGTKETCVTDSTGEPKLWRDT